MKKLSFILATATALISAPALAADLPRKAPAYVPPPPPPADEGPDLVTQLEKVFAESDSSRSKRVLLQGWEQFDEPVDRIVSIGAFEHLGLSATTTSLAWPTTRCPMTG